MRLIDADALLDAISVHLERIEQEFDDAPTITNIKYTPYTIETTGESKTETINPVKHGRWELDEKSDSIKCSECGKDALIDKIGVGYVIQLCSDYCPYCGARMDGDEG